MRVSIVSSAIGAISMRRPLNVDNAFRAKMDCLEGVDLGTEEDLDFDVFCLEAGLRVDFG